MFKHTNESVSCPFCGVEGVNIAHVSACSIADAKEKLSKSVQDMSVLWKAVNGIMMVKTYEDTTPKLQESMYTCTQCYSYGFAKTMPRVCNQCEAIYTIVSAKEYIKKLMEDSS